MTELPQLEDTHLDKEQKKITPQRVAFVVYVAFATFLCAGVIWGWSALLLILEKNGLYENLCDTENKICPERDKKLNLIFTSGTFAFFFSGLFGGISLDRFGSVKVYGVGSFFFTLGFIIFGASDLSEFNGYIAGMVFLGASSPCLLYSLMSIGRFYPGWESTIIGIVNCCFDASAIMFAIFKLIVDGTGARLGTIFIIYGFLCFYLAVGVFAWPELGLWNRINNHKMEPVEEHSKPNTKQISFLELIRTQLLTLDYLFFFMFMIVSVTWVSTYPGVVTLQLASFFGKSKGDQLATIFNYILPAGIFAIPGVGYLLDRKGLFISFLVLASLLTAWSILNMIKIVGVQILNFLIYTVTRALLYSALVSYLVQTFGFSSMGAIYGLSSLVCGVSVFLVSQYFLVEYTQVELKGDYKIPGIVQIVTMATCYALPIYVFFRGRRRSTESMTASPSQLNLMEGSQFSSDESIEMN
uniref:Predicted protein n=1 Tax=Hordeum vulgare subsp. vulgare TaxID=112509 RepID=F2E7G6_HORVV|nr:predicted protein [Hordeum vulgare subsp. vulgare]